MYREYKDRVEELCERLKKTVVVIDEVHRLLSYKDGKEFTFFSNLLNCLKSRCKCVMLSATPITDPYKLVPLARFLLTDKEFRESPLRDLDTAKKFFDRYLTRNNNGIRHEQELVDVFRDRVSHFRCPSHGFPSVVHHDVMCYIEPHTTQHRAYRAAMGFGPNTNTTNITQEFLLSARLASNLAALPAGHCPRTRDLLKDVSIKFHTCLERIANKKGPFFVYSNFVTESGVDAFVQVLNRLYNYTERLELPFRRYAVLRSGDSEEDRQTIVDRFNSPENVDGRLVNILVGSPSSNEGINLKRLREIHILDPHWMPTATDQIVARGVRFGSHTDVEYKEVHVHHYHAIPRDPTLLSVDTHLKQIQADKRKVLQMFETVLQRASIKNHNITARRVANNTTNNYVITTLVQHVQEPHNNGPVPPAIKRKRTRITRLAPYNPRLLNRQQPNQQKRFIKKHKTWINLTNGNNKDVINLTNS